MLLPKKEDRKPPSPEAPEVSPELQRLFDDAVEAVQTSKASFLSERKPPTSSKEKGFNADTYSEFAEWQTLAKAVMRKAYDKADTLPESERTGYLEGVKAMLLDEHFQTSAKDLLQELRENREKKTTRDAADDILAGLDKGMLH